MVSESEVGAFIGGAPGGPKAERALAAVMAETGANPADEEGQRVVRALAAVRLGAAPEVVSKHLGWKEFESFCARLLRLSGYVVRENVVITKPRVQIDIVASGPTMTLSIDCKHWSKAHSNTSLADIAAAQKRRSLILKRRMAGGPPIASVILSFSAPEGGFVDGVALVPVRTLTNFVQSVESYTRMLELC